MTAQTAKVSRSNALPATYRLGEYVIENVLGHGGFGITYLARDTKLSSQVAIKEYFPQAFALRDRQSTIMPTTDGGENYRWGLQEFLKEARALAKFKHNHIVRVLRFLEANGTAYMVMEYEQGESLATYLTKTGGFLNEPTLLSIFLPILGGLQAVHDAGLLHLDIKPENIYLRSNRLCGY
jgi:serine/threonine protein kinase